MARVDVSKMRGVPIEPGRWRLVPLAIALFFGAISIAMAMTVPRPSELPAGAQPLPMITCAEALAPDAPRAFRIWASHEPIVGGLDVVEPPVSADLSCFEGGSISARTPTNASGAGVFAVEREGDHFRITTACLGCNDLPAPRGPRDRAQDQHFAGIGLGALAVLAFLYAWVQRPHDALRDLAPAAPRDAYVIEAPRVSSVTVRGKALEGPRIAGGAKGPRSAPATASYLEIPGQADYRSAAPKLVELVGPGLVNGLPVPPGERSPVLDGDRVDLSGANGFPIELPRGKVLRYLVREGAVELTGRVVDPSLRWRVLGVAVLGVAGFTLLHADLGARVAIGSIACALALFSLRFIPPRLGVRRTVRVPLDEIERGEAKLSFSQHEGLGLRIEVNAAYVAWMPQLGRLENDRRRALRRALANELNTIVMDLPRAPRGSSASSS